MQIKKLIWIVFSNFECHWPSPTAWHFFKTCCVLHNFSIECEGTKSYLNIFNKTERVVNRKGKKRKRSSINPQNLFENTSLAPLEVFMDSIPYSSKPPLDFPAENNPAAHKKMRQHLIENYNIRFQNKLLFWPSGLYSEEPN